MREKLQRLLVSVALAAAIAACGAAAEGLTALVGGPDLGVSPWVRVLVPMAIILLDQVRQELERYRQQGA